MTRSRDGTNELGAGIQISLNKLAGFSTLRKHLVVGYEVAGAATAAGYFPEVCIVRCVTFVIRKSDLYERRRPTRGIRA